MTLAPAASASRTPGRGPLQPATSRGELPAVDDHLVEPETHAEMIDGVVYETMSANEPHATQHTEVTHLLRGCLADGFEAAVDMLTRADKKTDVAPDVSVYPSARDPKTGGRQLEELAFEVCDSEREAHVTRKVKKLAKRGVRRLFYIDVEAHRLREWHHATSGWRPFDDDQEIVDRCFRVPIPAKALVDRVLADDTVARALLAANNRVIEQALSARERQGERRGERRGQRRGELLSLSAAVLRVLDRRGVAIDDGARAQVLACDDRERLDAWLDRAVTAATSADVFEP
jgi:hypothetical protein